MYIIYLALWLTIKYIVLPNTLIMNVKSLTTKLSIVNANIQDSFSNEHLKNSISFVNPLYNEYSSTDNYITNG